MKTQMKPEAANNVWPQTDRGRRRQWDWGNGPKEGDQPRPWLIRYWCPLLGVKRWGCPRH